MDNSKTTEKNDCSTKAQSNSTEISNPKEDSNIDIINCSPSSDDSEDIEDILSRELATSSSSSFDDSPSDFEISEPDNDEDDAQRMLFNDYPLQNESENLGLRKRKMNKRFSECTRSITWRTKWAEIKVKELNSQLRKYKTELESYSQAKNWDLEKSKLQGYDGKLIPFPYHDHKPKLYKRRKRKQVEKQVDIAAYTSNHTLFSYAETRIPPTCNARYPDTDHGTGCKTTKKEDGIEDDYVYYPKIDSNDDELVGRILCKIETLKETLTRHKQCIDELIAQESANVEEISKGCASSDHNEDVEVEEIQEDFRVEAFGGDLYLNNDSPNLRDLLMDDLDVNYEDETAEDDEKLRYFRKLMDSITGVPEGETDDEKEEDCAKRVTSKKRKK